MVLNLLTDNNLYKIKSYFDFILSNHKFIWFFRPNMNLSDIKQATTTTQTTSNTDKHPDPNTPYTRLFYDLSSKMLKELMKLIHSDLLCYIKYN